MHNRLIFLLIAFQAAGTQRPLHAATYSVFSPDKKLEVQLLTGNSIEYSVRYNGQTLMLPSAISMHIAGGIILGRNEQVKDVKEQAVRQTLFPVVPLKNKSVPDEYNELRIDFKNNFSLVFRVYDDGFAYRFLTRLSNPLIVEDEEAVFNFPEDEALLFPENKDFRTDAAKPYLKERLSAISFNRFSVLPTLVDFENGVKIVLTEADLVDYPGMYLRGNSNHSFYGKFPQERARQTQWMDKPGWDRHVQITETKPYIAKTSGTRAFPWRVLVITANDRDLVASEMVYKLSQPNRIADVSWIKPGKAAWDWWNNNNLTGVDFQAGMNTKTYKYYIDFAARQHLDYIIIDEGWYVLGNLLNTVPEMNMPEIISYGREKGVGVFLWVVYKTLEDQLPEAMESFQRWGVRGLKVDFMELDDQTMINNYFRISKAAADRKLMVEFHGSSKPDGISGPYPNVLTRDLAPGLEFNKWEGGLANPEMAVTLPFIRMVAGPMDYTPGAMTNANERDYVARYNNPMSLGTRCQQMAMFIVYESPLTVMADNASRYEKEPECTHFICGVPTVWDKTVVPDAKVGDYIVVARKKGTDWYIGAMTDWTQRTIKIPLDFLDKTGYEMEFFQDGINAGRNAMDYMRGIKTVSSRDTLQIVLAPGGGWAAKLGLKLKSKN